ncbi:hypothetical protein SUGI_1176640 [Cryptomeria japonica]|nr:hypothetical protein SUGI_1176640 [Cryptomeria japonica]
MVFRNKNSKGTRFLRYYIPYPLENLFPLGFSYLQPHPNLVRSEFFSQSQQNLAPKRNTRGYTKRNQTGRSLQRISMGFQWEWKIKGIRGEQQHYEDYLQGMK